MDLALLQSLILVLGAAGFGGGVLSLLVSLVVDAQWDKRAKDTVAFFTCLAVALLGCITLGMDLTNFAMVLPTMIVFCHLTYVKVWKPTGIGGWIETFWSTTPKA